MKKLRARDKITSLVYIANVWQEQDLNPGLLAPEPAQAADTVLPL